MSSADLPPFVFAFKMFVLFVGLITFCVVGKFLGNLFLSWNDSEEMKEEWRKQKRTEAKEKRKAAKKKAQEEEDLKTTASQLVEEMVDLVVLGEDGQKLNLEFNLIEINELKKKQKQVEKKEVKVEVEKEVKNKKEEDVVIEFFSDDDSEDSTTATPISSTSTSADETPIAYSDFFLKNSFFEKTPGENFSTITFSSKLSPRPPPFSSLGIPSLPSETNESVPTSPNSTKKQEVFSVA